MADQAHSTTPRGADDLEDLVVAALEASPDERRALLGRLEREDADRARRVRSRVSALKELGMALDGPRRPAHLPERFGSYRREERVGGGGMGEVYRARDVRTGALAALKLIRPEHLLFENARTRFHREIEASSRLEHPGIVRVLEVGEESGVPWLAMEWVGGVSLDAALERLRGRSPEGLGPRDLERAVGAAARDLGDTEPARDDALPGESHVEVAVGIVVRVARALAVAHREGVLHRDVKPSNVLVTPAGRVLLADFGLALPRGADRMTRTGQWLGSLPYAAPEQIEGSPRELDARADVYSLAATLYELITLRTPFLGGPESTVRRRIATGDLERPRRLVPALSREVERVLLAALDPDPARRPAGAAAFADDLEAALAGRPVTVRAAPPWVRARRWVRRHPVPALVASVAALVVVGSLAVALRENALAARLVRLGDAELARGLQEEAAEFWPASPRRIEAMRDWLERADDLLRRAPEHRVAFEALTARALPYGDEERARDLAEAREGLATLSRELDGLETFVRKGDRTTPPTPPSPEEARALDAAFRGRLAGPPEAVVADLRERIADLRAAMGREPLVWRSDVLQLDDFERLLERVSVDLRGRGSLRFPSSLEAWRHDSLRRLLADLGRLEGLVAEVRAQLTTTLDLAARFEGADAAAWDRAVAAVRASPRYGGLELTPLFGLEPLGEDPVTGFWDFLLVASGERPERRAGGGWDVREETGVVLVLLPGGRFAMGQTDSEGGDAAARPRHEVVLEPFLCSRYELTSAQAVRLGGFPAERTHPGDGRLPVVLDWTRARAMLRRQGLDLPTESRWEYAARAGGNPGALEAVANVYDLARARALRQEGAVQGPSVASFDDGFPDLAPVGSLAPNGFGLHDLLGNVSEWCLDPYVSRGYSTLRARAGDGLRETVVPAQVRVVRGGNHMGEPWQCAPWVRLHEVPSRMPLATGVRPVRGLDPE